MKKVCENLWTSFLFSPMARERWERSACKIKISAALIKTSHWHFCFLPLHRRGMPELKRLLSLNKIPFLVFSQWSKWKMSKVFFNPTTMQILLLKDAHKIHVSEKKYVLKKEVKFFRWYCTQWEVVQTEKETAIQPSWVELNVNKREKIFTTEWEYDASREVKWTLASLRDTLKFKWIFAWYENFRWTE